MKYGAIDIGTNSMRLLLAKASQGKFLDRQKFVNTTRLGAGLDERGRIKEECIQVNIEALEKFSQKCREYGCDKVFCIGTAALRNSKNKEEFIKRAKEKTGIDLEVISGKKEAFLGYKGVVGGIDLADDYALILDIGGGSTEFIFGSSREIFYRKSIDLGALALTEKFITSMPEDRQELKKLEDFIDRELLQVSQELREVFDKKMIAGNFKLLGIGGTITSLSAINQELEEYSMEKIHGSFVSREEVEGQISKISMMSLEERRKIKGLQAKRAEIILSGEIILNSIMKKLSSSKIQISEFDNLEGIILEDMSKFDKKQV